MIWILFTLPDSTVANTRAVDNAVSQSLGYVLYGTPRNTGKQGKGAYSSLWIGNPSHSYGASPAIWDHTVLPTTRHRWTRPALTPAMQAGTRFTYPEGWKAELTLVDGCIPRWFTCPQTVTHPSSNHSIATRPGVEPTTSRSQVQRPNRYTTKQLK